MRQFSRACASDPVGSDAACGGRVVGGQECCEHGGALLGLANSCGSVGIGLRNSSQTARQIHSFQFNNLAGPRGFSRAIACNICLSGLHRCRGARVPSQPRCGDESDRSTGWWQSSPIPGCPGNEIVMSPRRRTRLKRTPVARTPPPGRWISVMSWPLAPRTGAQYTSSRRTRCCVIRVSWHGDCTSPAA